MTTGPTVAECFERVREKAGLAREDFGLFEVGFDAGFVEGMHSVFSMAKSSGEDLSLWAAARREEIIERVRVRQLAIDKQKAIWESEESDEDRSDSRGH